MGNRNTTTAPAVAEKPEEKAVPIEKKHIEKKTCWWEIKIGNEMELELAKRQHFECTITDSKGSKSHWMFWFPRKSLKGMGTNKEAMLFYMLKEEDDCCSEIDARVSVLMRLSNGLEIAEGQSDPDCWRHTAGMTRTCYVENDKSDSLDPDVAKEMQPPNSKPLTFVFVISLEVLTKAEPEVHEESADHALERIREKRTELMWQKLAKLENDPKNSDMKIVSKDGQEFYAYSWILDEVSDVLKAAFRAEFEMKKENDNSKTVVKLEDVSGSAVKLILHFIYTGEVADEWSAPGTIEEFISGVDNYEIKDLKMFLDANLGKVCTIENAGNLLTFAVKASLKKAQADIGAFVAENCEPATKRTKLN